MAAEWSGPRHGGLMSMLIGLMCVGACESRDQTSGSLADAHLGTRFATESETTIGGDAATGPKALGVIGTARLADSSILVPELIAQEIRVFDLSGEYVETFGRRGAGPGEYEALGAAFELPGGGVVGWERGPRTATVQGVSGIATFPLLQGQFPSRTPRLLGILGDTSFVVRLPREAPGLRGSPPGRFTDTVPFVRVDRRGAVRDTLALIEAPQREFFDVGPMWGLELEIFGDELRATVTGEWLVIVSGREIRRYPTSGPGSALVHEWEPPSRTATPDLILAERERRIRELRTAGVVDGNQNLGEMHREVIRELPVTDPLPAFDYVAAGSGGKLWVRTLTMPTDTVAEWVLIDADGRIEGHLRLPTDERIESGSTEHVIVRSTDTLGSVVLRVLRLR